MASNQDTEERLKIALADHYNIQEEIGRGGMATVYLAEDLKHHRRVAVKVLDPELSAVVGSERFLSEIETTANLQHPNILPLFDSGEADHLLFYVMPYVEGESLRDRLNRETQLPVEDAVRITREIADGLGHAHGLEVVHRDIKPENVLLSGGHALIADFGIGRAVTMAGGTRLTETGLSLGTPQYMSPEQLEGREADSRTDIFSLGTVLFETQGWISSPRFSRDGRHIGFLHHPSPGDNRGQVGMADLAGNSRLLTEPYTSTAGLACHAMERYGDALAFYDRAVELEPKMVMLYVNRAHAKRNLGKLDAALEDLALASKQEATPDEVSQIRELIRKIERQKEGG